MAKDARVYQPARVIVGNCPNCGRVVCVHNDHEVWAYVDCECGAKYPTTLIVNPTRVERHGARVRGE